MTGGRKPKEKGNKFERLVAELLSEIYPDAKRGIGQARAAAEVSDVSGVPWWVECKHGKKVLVRAALKQARTAEVAYRVAHEEIPDPGCATCLADQDCKRHPKARANRTPTIVVYRDDGAPINVLMLWEDFRTLLLRAEGYRIALSEPASPSESSAPSEG